MAAPIIDTVTPALASLSPGEFVDVTIEAHDPDSASASTYSPRARRGTRLPGVNNNTTTKGRQRDG